MTTCGLILTPPPEILAAHVGHTGLITTALPLEDLGSPPSAKLRRKTPAAKPYRLIFSRLSLTRTPSVLCLLS